MLASHEKSNHDVCDFVVRELASVPVFLIGQGCDHIGLVILTRCYSKVRMVDLWKYIQCLYPPVDS